MRFISVLLVCLVLMTALMVCGPNEKELELKQFIDNHVSVIQPIMTEMAKAYWEAAVTGNPDSYEKYSDLELRLRKIRSNRSDFELLKSLQSSGRIKNPSLARQLTILIHAYMPNQVDPELLRETVELSTRIEKAFNTFRSTIDGKKVTSNDIREILKNETDNGKRKKAWIASKQVGKAIADDIIQLVRLRNKAAKKLGFDSYHTMALAAGEQDVHEITRIFDELYGLTQAPYERMKGELDAILADKYGIAIEDLKPWHYHDPFFQETPLVYDLDLDRYYADTDIRDLASSFYASIGLPVDSILAKSDLYEKEGKNPHAFCIDIDYEGDVRILCNLKNNESWMETLLHELGHAVYDYYKDYDVPLLMREPAHSFTTEAVAMFFGRLSRNADWMQQMLGLSESQRDEIYSVAVKYAQLKQLIFARWAMVMFEFEKELYADPDQDLNQLWWDLKEKYQLIQKPAGRNVADWASKIHIASYPCYYHNYLLGELLASQFHNHLVFQVLNLDSDTGVTYIDEPSVGQYFKKYVFETGNTMPWNDMIRKATGEKLNPRFFVDQFVMP